MCKVKIGKEYDILHTRKGKFKILVNTIRGTLVTGTITKGTAFYLSEPNRDIGDMIQLNTDSNFVNIVPAIT